MLLRVLFLLALSACSSPPPSYNLEFLAMGTTVSIDIVGTDSDVAATEARTELQRIGREWYAWSDDGELVRLNAALAEGHPFQASPELAQLLSRSRQLHEASQRTFDPAIGGLVKMWGFDVADHSGIAPTQKQITAWRKDHPTLSDVSIEGTTINSSRRDVVIDLGAIGKGYAVDRAIEILRAQGAQHVLVNAGGNLRALSDPRFKPWRIAIRHPRAVAALAWLELQGDESVATSGDYERFAFVKGKRIHHLLDPRSGDVANATAAVTVVTTDATLADAASTALFVAGDEWQTVARALNIRQALRVTADGRVQVSRLLRDRLSVKDTERQLPEWEIVDL